MKNAAKYSLFTALLGLSLTACQKQADPQPEVLETKATADANGQYFLKVGETLTSGQSLVAFGDAAFRLVQQADGNLVLVQVFNNQPVWNTGTQGNPGARTTLLSDGRLVVLSRSNATLYSSPAKGQAAHQLRLASTSLNVRLQIISGTIPTTNLYFKRF